MTGYDNTYIYGKYWSGSDGGPAFDGSSISEVCTAIANWRDVALGSISGGTCYFVEKISGAPYNTTRPNQYPCSSYTTSIVSCYSTTDPKLPQRTPMTDAEWAALPMFDWSTLNDGFQNIPTLKDNGLPLESTSFKPFSDWIGSPYFKDGMWWRDRVDISPCPTSSQPTRVCVDIGPQKFEGATDPETVPTEATESPTGTTSKEQTKFCDDNPQSIACLELGELEEEKLIPDERPFQITPDSPWGQGNASCPAPQTEQLRTGALVTYSYQPTCDFFSSIRPAVIAVAFLAALFIALGIPAGKGD